jgi:RNA polymerase sigma-70 factor, ECF subfamily
MPPSPTIRVNDTELIRSVLQGDPAAERALYDRHVDRVYRLAFRMAGDEELAKEFTQETFIRAFQRLKDFRGDAALATWLHTIAVSVALNGLRKVNRSRKREVELEHAPLLAAETPHVEPKLAQRLRSAIDGLSERCRTVFIMHDVEGFTHEEIGSVLSVAAGTSKATLFRARMKLREQLADVAKEYAR